MVVYLVSCKTFKKYFCFTQLTCVNTGTSGLLDKCVDVFTFWKKIYSGSLLNFVLVKRNITPEEKSSIYLKHRHS